MHACSAFISKSFFFLNNSGIPSECQKVWIQIRPDFFVWPHLCPICLQRFIVADTSRLRVDD